MANFSDLTRREQVLLKLQQAEGAWVNGTDLATAEVGGSEGLRRLRELCDLGYNIRKRQHPDGGRDIWQYRLAPPVEKHWTDALVVEETFDPPAWEIARDLPEPAEKYDYSPPPRSRMHLGKTPDGKYIAVSDAPPPVPKGQTTILEPVEEIVHHKFTSMPTHLDMFTMRICPVCKGYRRPIKEKDPITGKIKKPEFIIGYEEKSRDPDKPEQDCRWCDGWGVIPV